MATFDDVMEAKDSLSFGQLRSLIPYLIGYADIDFDDALFAIRRIKELFDE